MSKINRKTVYDKLIKEGRTQHISEALQKEFGSELPQAKPEPILKLKAKEK